MAKANGGKAASLTAFTAEFTPRSEAMIRRDQDCIRHIIITDGRKLDEPAMVKCEAFVDKEQACAQV